MKKNNTVLTRHAALPKVKKEQPFEAHGSYVDLDLTEEEIAEYKKRGYVVEDLTELPKAQTGKQTPTYADSLFLYNNALKKNDFYVKNKYTKIQSATDFKDPEIRRELVRASAASKNTPIDPEAISSLKAVTKNQGFEKYRNQKSFGPVKGTNLHSFGDILQFGIDEYYHPNAPKIYLHPGISPQGSVGYKVELKGNGKKFRDQSDVPYYDPLAIKPGKLLTDAEIKTRVKKYGTKGIPESRLKDLNIPYGTAVSSGYLAGLLAGNNESDKAPVPEVGKLQTKSFSQISNEAVEKIKPTTVIPSVQTPKTLKASQKYKPIKTESRDQTIMEPDPNRPGKYRMKELRQVPYSAYFPGEGWQPMHAPRVLWINSEGEEVEEDPRKSAGSLANLKFGGNVVVANTDAEKRKGLTGAPKGSVGVFNFSTKGVQPFVRTDRDLDLFADGKKVGKLTKDNPVAFVHFAKQVVEKEPLKAQDGDYVELELTDEEIQQYRNGGYYVEEIDYI